MEYNENYEKRATLWMVRAGEAMEWEPGIFVL